MNTKENGTVESGESKKSAQVINSTRRSFAKVGVLAPVVMTLTSKTVLGANYQCTISGAQSGNTSQNSEDMTACRRGYLASEWAGSATLTTGNGNITDWHTSQVLPYKIRRKNSPDFVYEYDLNGDNNWISADSALSAVLAQFYLLNLPYMVVDISITPYEILNATTFVDIFGNGDAVAVHNKLLSSNTDLSYDASVDYLNAKLDLISPISPQDVIDLYKLGANGITFADGNKTISNQAGAIDLLKNLHL